MTRFNVVFANIFQGMIYAGKTGLHQDVFTGWHPAKHAEALASFQPDICCVAEMIFDGQDGSSAAIETYKSILGLPYAQVAVTEKSWVVEGKYYGLAIFSRYPMTDYRVDTLLTPPLLVVRPNGDVWRMHDKVVQSAVMDVSGQPVKIFNLHAFPFYAFNRRIDESEFDGFRHQLTDMLLAPNVATPTIVCGDFNNKDVPIRQAFPGLFETGRLKNIVEVTSQTLEAMNKTVQLDHILASPHFTITGTAEQYKLSDHPILLARLALSGS